MDRRRDVLGPAHPQTLLAVYNFGASALQTGDHEAALPAFVEVITNGRDVIPPHHPVHAAAVMNLVTVCDAVGWSAMDEAAVGRLMETVADADADRLSAAQQNVFAYAMATVEPAELRDVEAAVSLSRRAVATAETVEDPYLYGYLDTLATCLRAAGRLDEALAVVTRAIELTPEDRTDDLAAIRDNRRRIESEREPAASGGSSDARADEAE
jgi:tetratricopeptide (TPR) repeat protein